MIGEIGLYYADIWPQKKNGPGKVAKNLIAGLTSLGVEVHHNTLLKYTGVLQSYPLLELKESALIGPNHFVLPNECDPLVWKKKRNIVTPSKWMKDKYITQLDSKHNVYVWPVGIDTNHFVPRKGDKKIDCLIYYKQAPLCHSCNDLFFHPLGISRGINLKNLLRKLIDSNIKFKEIIYGEYNEKELIEIAQSSRFCVMISCTETQGIAYQEILSMNIPIYVIDYNITHQFKPNECPGATSAPYFDDRCGIKHKDLGRFDEFLERLDEFSPREYILENLTLEKCASEYISLLEKCNE